MSFQRRDSDDAELARTLQEQENFLGEEADIERAMKLSAQEASTREALARTALSSTRTSAPVSEGKAYNPPSTPTSVPTSTPSTPTSVPASTPTSTSSSTSLPSRSSSSGSSSTSLSQSHSAKHTSSVSSGTQTTTGDSESLALARKLQEEEDLKFSRQLEEEQAPRRGRRQQALSEDDLGAPTTPTPHPPRASAVHRVFHQPGSSGGHVSFVMSSSGTHMLPMQIQHSGFPLAAMQQIFGGGMMPFPFQPSVDVDSMSYEELLELEERMGKVKRGATDEDITQLPTSKFRKKTPAPLSSSPPTSSLPTSSGIGASAFSTSPPKSEKSPTEAKAAPPPSEDKSCCICLEDFQDGEDIRRLPCFHIFHQDEIDKWLREHNSCPICKTPIPTSTSSPSS